jgi:hypothetical protein
VTAQKTNADAVTDAPSRNVLSDGVDDPDDLMPGYHRLGGVGAHALNGEHVAVAYTAAAHAKPYVARLRFE